MLKISLIHSISQIWEFIFLAFATAALELSFQKYMGSGMILEFWHSFLHFKLFKKHGLRKKLAMILGYYEYCNGFWVATIFYILYYKEISLLLLLFTGINCLFIRILSLIDKP
jgi:hypothetical protein